MKRISLFLLAWPMYAVMHGSAHAEIYKSVDEHGHVTYSNVPSKGAIKLDIDPPPPAPPPKPKPQATPSDFPRIDTQTQKKRDEQRKQILLEELEAERAALEEAKKAYAEGESKPEVYRGANGKTYRNVAKFEEKMKRLQAEVDAHERNVQLLEKELEAFK
ncbi:DUF4124 domain-containing protein [Methylobacillus flagellatus]|uniref:DUF4124 domain-containing protein n=1 Tax=Methylobacillus flagellatus (strain ATCC 51484 / DSM 6875 / VKM B-1610 / KT) TaxID=265072 RepID=Q1GYH4_METFK|nr:DUF4124 domain-containing protein [Methylobacillus flagellatus]ABE50713.1 conserved hypothetical protein [Methylobacillus flagellatus KT]